MSGIYENYCELAEFFGTDAFESLDVEILTTLSFEALFQLQSLVMQAIAQKVEEKK